MTHPYGRKWRKTKEPLDESEKVGLKLNIQKTKIMASGPITLWQIDGETVETVADFIFGSSKITADGDCSHEIKRRLLLGRKVMTNLDSILKSRDTTLLAKVCLVKAIVFPVVMYGCESWTDYKESWASKNWCFQIVVLEKTLESPMDCKEIQPVHPKGDQSWVFIGRTDVEAETPNTLATWCEELTHLKRPWCWERLRAWGEGDDRGWDGWMASLTQWTWVWVDSRSWWWTGRPGVLWFMGLQRVRQDWATELNWLKIMPGAITYICLFTLKTKICLFLFSVPPLPPPPPNVFLSTNSLKTSGQQMKSWCLQNIFKIQGNSQQRARLKIDGISRPYSSLFHLEFKKRFPNSW